MSGIKLKCFSLWSCVFVSNFFCTDRVSFFTGRRVTRVVYFWKIGLISIEQSLLFFPWVAFLSVRKVSNIHTISFFLYSIHFLKRWHPSTPRTIMIWDPRRSGWKIQKKTFETIELRCCIIFHFDVQEWERDLNFCVSLLFRFFCIWVPTKLRFKIKTVLPSFLWKRCRFGWFATF